MNTTLAYTPIDDLQKTQEIADQAKAANARSGLPHVHIGLNTTVRVTRERPARERSALRWLSAYINREKIAAEAIRGELGVDVIEIRAALTDAGADVAKLIPRIESLRAVLDAKLRQPADTTQFREIVEAFAFACDEGALVEYVDLTRTGKTTTADWLHLTNLDDAVLIDCPSAESYAAFIIAVAQGCGIRVSEGKKGRGPERIEAQIEAMLGAGGITKMIIDEGHYLWPTNIGAKPKRIEFVRKLWDRMKGKLAIFILSTPQTILSANQAQQKENKRWSPGQWEGRVNRFFPASEEVTIEDMAKVARWHCPEGSSAVIELLVAAAKASPGFYGLMVNALKRARSKASRAKEKMAVTHLQAAVRDAIKGTMLAAKVARKGLAS